MKSIFKRLTLVVLMFGLVFALFGCKKNDAKALANYLLKQDSKVVEEDFVLDGKLSFGDKEYELSWASNNNAIQIEKRDNDYLAKVNYPDQETVVTLTVTLGKASKEFSVTVLPIDVYKFSQSYVFPKDKQTVTESFDLDTSCTYAGKTATITWSVDEAYAEYIAINEEGNRCLVTPTSLDPEVKIKATFSYNGEETTKQYRMTVSQNMSDEERVDYWYSNTGVSQVISGYVVAKGNWKEYNGTNEAIICVLDDSGLCGYYLYLEPTEMDKEAFQALQIGAHVTNTGSVNTNYSGLQETTNYKGMTVLDADIPVKEIVPFAIDNDLISGSPVGTYMTSTLVSLTNWEVKEVKTWSTSSGANTILVVTKGGVDVPIVISKYFLLEPDSLGTDTTVIPAIQESVKDLKAGDFVNIKGILSNYNGPQIVAHLADSITAGEADTTAAADLPGTLVKALLNANKEKTPKGLVTANTTIEFAASTDKVTVAYELLSHSEALEFNENNLVITPGKAESATIKVTYTCGSYSTYQLIKVKSQKVSDEEMVAAELAKITNFNVEKTTDLASKGEVYEDVAIAWALKEASDGVVIENGKLVVGAGLDKDVVLVATLTAGEASQTKEVTVHVTTPALSHNGTPTDPLDAKTAIMMAGQLDGPSKEMSEFAYFVTGTITDDPSADYCNFHFKDGDKEIVIYGLWAANGKDRYGSKREIAELPVKKGDEVALYAKLQNFQGTLELANAILLSVNGEDTGAKITLSAREAVLIAGELDPDTKEKTENAYYFEVTITDDPTADYCNFHFAYGNDEVLVYGLYAENGTDRYGSKREIAELPVKKGDKVVLLAKVQNFGGTLQLSGAILVSVDKPVVIEHAGTEADPFTVSDAIAKTEQETEKKDNAYTAAKYYVTGVVKSVKYYDITVNGEVVGKDATIELQEGDKVVKASYTITPDTIETIYVGDTVTAYGFLQYYSGSSSLYPKDKANSETGEWPVAISVVHGTSTVSVASDSSEHATIKELSAESGVNGTTFTFKVEADEDYVIDLVKVNGKEVEAVDGVYSAVIAGPTTISVTASEAQATEKTIEFDFSVAIEGFPTNAASRHSTKSVEVTYSGVTLDIRNAYQTSYNSPLYILLAGKSGAADADSNGEAVEKVPGWIANKTPIPGRIISITVYGNGGASGSTVYYLDAFDSAKLEALESSETTVTGLKDSTFVYTAAEDANLYYFNLTTTTVANGQVSKIVVVYEPGEVPQPAPTLTGVKVAGAVEANLELNAESGLYEGEFSLQNLWSTVKFVGLYSDESQAAFTYADTTFAGNGILPARVANSPENAQLYADSDELVNGGSFCYGISGKTNYVVTYDPQTKTVTVNVEEPGANATLSGVAVKGAASAELVLDEESGLYEGTFALSTLYATVQFVEKYSDETEKPITYANATILGSGIFEKQAEGAPWTATLFIDTPAAAETGSFCYSMSTESKYLVRYNPETKVLFVDLDLAEVPASIKGVKFDGAKQGSFELKDGKYEAVVSLNQWNRISFTVVDENDQEIALWYTNATFTGAITAENKLGDAYDHTLYHESGDGLQWMPGAGSTRTYKFVYDPSTKTMSVERDTTAPVITISAAVQSALAAHDFVENEDASALFGQLLAGISANDDMDGAIAVTQEMVDLGGLTLNKLVAGDYKLAITVKDVAGNEAKQEVPIHVRSMYANVDLLADSPNKHADYNSSNWTYDKYTSSWVDVTGTQMRCREKKDANQQSVWTINMACGYSTTYRYKYSTGKSLGIANKITVTWSNDYSSPQDIGVKIILVDAQGNQHYALGAAGNDGFVAIAAGTLLDAQEYTFDDVEVKTVMFVLYSKKSDGAFIYVNDVVLSYEEEQPVSSPAAFQVATDANNHIDGAGVEIWVTSESINLSDANWGTSTHSVAATAEGYTVNEAFLSVPSAATIRCFVGLNHAPAADELLVLNISITVNGVVYQGTVSFQNGVLA